MARIYDRELSEVTRLLDGRKLGEKYVKFQRHVKAKLKELAEKPEIIGRVYDIKSREDLSPHEPLKSKKKIALKLRKWRKLNPSARILDIHDIAGVTIVCPYPSDVECIKNAIDKFLEPLKNEIIISESKLMGLIPLRRVSFLNYYI